MDPEDQATATPEPSMDDFMGEAFDKMGAADEPAPVEPEKEIEAPEPEKAADDAKPDADATDEAAPDADETTDGEPAEQTITAPPSMSAKDREAFYAQSPENQKWLTDRMQEHESSFTKKNMELAEQRKTYDKIEQIIAPRRQQLALDGMDESTAIGQLFALSDFANKDPVAFTRYLFNQRGLSLSALTESGGQTTADPQLTAMMNEIHGLKNSITQQQTQAQDAAGQAINSAIEEFANDKAYPFYGELENDMIPLVDSLRRSQPGLTNKEYLAKAYKAAIGLNDSVSAKVDADNKAKMEVARIAKAKKAADAAKKAAGAKTRNSGAIPAAAKKAKDVDEFIGALVDERMTA